MLAELATPASPESYEASAVSARAAAADQPGAAQAMQHLRGQLRGDALRRVAVRIHADGQPVALVAGVNVRLPGEGAAPRQPGGEPARVELRVRILHQAGAAPVVRRREVVRVARGHREQPHGALRRIRRVAEVHVPRDVAAPRRHGTRRLPGLWTLLRGNLGDDARRRVLDDRPAPRLIRRRLHPGQPIAHPPEVGDRSPRCPTSGGASARPGDDDAGAQPADTRSYMRTYSAISALAAAALLAAAAPAARAATPHHHRSRADGPRLQAILDRAVKAPG